MRRKRELFSENGRVAEAIGGFLRLCQTLGVMPKPEGRRVSNHWRFLVLICLSVGLTAAVNVWIVSTLRREGNDMVEALVLYAVYVVPETGLCVHWVRLSRGTPAPAVANCLARLEIHDTLVWAATGRRVRYRPHRILRLSGVAFCLSMAGTAITSYNQNLASPYKYVVPLNRVCMFLIMNSLIGQYAVLQNCVRDMTGALAQAASRPPVYLSALSSCQFCLTRVSLSVTRLFAPQLILVLFSSFYYLAFTSFYLLLNLSNGDASTFFELLFISASYVLDFYTLLSTVDGANTTTKQFKESMVKSMLKDHSPITEKNLLYAFKPIKIDFFLAGLFELNLGVLVSILEAVSTFIIILVQFKIYTDNKLYASTPTNATSTE